MTNQSELDELDEIINAALTRIVLAFGADDKSLIPKIKSDARKGVEDYITANYTPNSEVTDQVREATGGHVRETYYNNDCPNNLHIFALLGDTETCVYCYVKDNPPTKGAPNERL